MENIVLGIVGVAVMVTLVVTEILLIRTMRSAVQETRGVRRELPIMFGAVLGVLLLMGAAQYLASQGKARGLAPLDGG